MTPVPVVPLADEAASVVVGVGHFSTWLLRPSPPAPRRSRLIWGSDPRSGSLAFGVFQEGGVFSLEVSKNSKAKPALAQMGSADLLCGCNHPCEVVPEFGKRAENGIESPNNDR